MCNFSFCGFFNEEISKWISIALIIIGLSGVLWGITSLYHSSLGTAKHISLITGSSLLTLIGIALLTQDKSKAGKKMNPLTTYSSSVDNGYWKRYEGDRNLKRAREFGKSNSTYGGESSEESSEEKVKKYSKKRFDPYPWNDDPSTLDPKTAYRRLRRFEKHPEYVFNERELDEHRIMKRLKLLHQAKHNPRIMGELEGRRRAYPKKPFDYYPWNDPPDQLESSVVLERMLTLQKHLNCPLKMGPCDDEFYARRHLTDMYQQKMLMVAEQQIQKQEQEAAEKYLQMADHSSGCSLF